MSNRPAFLIMLSFILLRNAYERTLVRTHRVSRETASGGGFSFFLLIASYLMASAGTLYILWVERSLVEAGFLLGLILGVIGYVGRVISVRELGLSYSYSLTPVSQRLVTVGPYAYVRHPIYSCYMLEVAGIALAAPNILTLFAWIVLAVTSAKRASQEEDGLVAAFGDEYRLHREATWRFFPYIF